MQQRSEEQKLAQDPVMVTFGGKEYPLRVLVIKESREWRQQVIDLIKQVPPLTSVSSDKPEEFNAALETLLISMPDQVCDLFFSYAKDLNREEIELVATDAEMALAWSKVTDLAFPLLQGLVKTMGKIAQ